MLKERHMAEILGHTTLTTTNYYLVLSLISGSFITPRIHLLKHRSNVTRLVRFDVSSTASCFSHHRVATVRCLFLIGRLDLSEMVASVKVHCIGGEKDEEADRASLRFFR